MRNLEESSWLAQVIKDKMEVEFDKNGDSSRWHCLHTFYIIVREADNPDNDNIYYSNYNGQRSIMVREIPSMVTPYGLDFDTNGMQCKLRGLAERYTDDNGQYVVSVLTTHDLNSASINDISELLYQLGTH